MSDYSVVSERQILGPFDRLKESIKGVFIGIILFVLAFPVLFFTERRTNLGEVVEKAAPVDFSATVSGKDGQPVRGEGPLTVATPAVDKNFLTKPDFLHLERISEVFAVHERKETKTRKEGTKEIRETIYHYENKWEKSPQDSSKFHEAKYRQPLRTRKFNSQTFYAQGVKVGPYEVDPSKARLMKSIDISPEADHWVEGPGRKPSGTYMYFSSTAAASPAIGDERLHYRGWPLNSGGEKVSVAGTISGSRIEPITYDESGRFLALHPGTALEMIAQLKSEHSAITWVVRVVGFIMMWAGMSMMIGPFTTALSFVPILGSFGNGFIHLVLGMIAFILTLITVLFAQLFWLVVVLGALTMAIFAGLIIKGLTAQPRSATA
jgi:hypothetical protein